MIYFSANLTNFVNNKQHYYGSKLHTERIRQQAPLRWSEISAFNNWAKPVALHILQSPQFGPQQQLIKEPVVVSRQKQTR